MKVNNGIISSFLLVACRVASAQAIPATGHPGHMIDPWHAQGQYKPSYGYVSCDNGCQVAIPNPDPATLQALQYADVNGFPEIIFNLNGIKFTTLCRINQSDPKASACMLYQAPYSQSNPHQEPANWIAEPGLSTVFVGYDLCIDYYAPNDNIGAENNWPEQCGPYPYYRPLPSPSDPNQQLPPGVPIYSPPPQGDCTGTHICHNPS